MRSSLSGLLLCLAATSAAIFATQGCASKKSSEAAAVVADDSDLTWDQSKARKERLSQVTYDLKVDITAAKSEAVEANFKGDLTLRFTLKGAKQPLRLDFAAGELSAITVNAKAVPLDVRKKHSIELPASSLVEGANVVTLSYSAPYSRSGEGFYRFSIRLISAFICTHSLNRTTRTDLYLASISRICARS